MPAAFNFGKSQCPRLASTSKPERAYKGSRIVRQVRGVAELSAHRAESQYGIHIFGIVRDGGRLGVLDVLANPQRPADQAKLFLGLRPWRNVLRRGIRAVQVPGVEPCKVLDCAQYLVASNCRAQLLGHSVKHCM